MRIELSVPFLSERIASLLLLPCPSSAPTYIYAISTDSREVEFFDLFVDFIGDYFHQKQAAERASLLLCPPSFDAPWASKSLFTSNVKEAFLTLAATYGKYFPCKKIAVAGSAGKTTAKEYLYSILKTAYRTQKNTGNYNNEIGLAYTLFALQPKTEFLIAETGMNHAGELRRLSLALCPQSVILTNVGDAHLGNFNSREELTDAKLEILEGMSADGTLFYGSDSPPLQNRRYSCKSLSVGLQNADYTLKNVRTDRSGTIFDISTPKEEMTKLKVPSFGKYTALSAAFAVALAEQLGMDEKSIKEGLSDFEMPPLRQGLHTLKNGTLLLLDCYNASPASMRAAMETAKELCVAFDAAPSVLLGGMHELGEHTESAHRMIGEYAYQMGVKRLFSFGQYAALYAEGALAAGMPRENVFLFDAPNRECAEAICKHLSKNDLLLVKASRGEKAEKVLSELLKIQEE